MSQRFKEDVGEQLLASYLNGKPEAEQAAVLKLVTQLGIERDDPLWAVLISINAATVLLQDAPVQLNQVCSSFQADLDARATGGRQLIQALSGKAQEVEALSHEAAGLRQELQLLRRQAADLTTQVEQAVGLLDASVSIWKELLIHQQREGRRQMEVVKGLAAVLRKLERRPAFLFQNGAVITYAALYSILFSVVGTVSLGLWIMQVL